AKTSESNASAQIARMSDGRSIAWVAFEQLLDWPGPGEPRSFARVFRWNQGQKNPTRVVTIPNAVWGEAAAISPDGRLLACGVSDAKRGIAVYDLENGGYLTFLRGQEYVRALAFASDGSLLASAALDSTVIVWDMRATRLEAQWSALASRKEADQSV